LQPASYHLIGFRLEIRFGIVVTIVQRGGISMHVIANPYRSISFWAEKIVFGKFPLDPPKKTGQGGGV
jgi:hypothetical protein